MRWIERIVSGMLCVAACLASAGCCGGEEKKAAAPPAPDYRSELRSVNKLVLGEMTVSKMATIEDLRLSDANSTREKFDALLNKFKLGTRKGVYSYRTYLRAYMDLSEMGEDDVVVDEPSKLMRIHLPEIRVEFAGRDLGVREEHYRVTGLRSKIRAEERAEVKEAVNESLRQEVEERSGFREKLVDAAKVKAEAYFRAFGAANGYQVEFF